MKTLPLVVTAAAGLIAYNLLKKAGGLAGLQFSPGQITNLEWQTGGPVMTIGIKVQNTSSQSFTLHSIAGTISSNGYYVADISSFISQTVGPNMQAVVYITARFKLLGIVNDIMRAWENRNFSQEIKIRATANVDNIQIPLALTYKIGQ